MKKLLALGSAITLALAAGAVVAQVTISKVSTIGSSDLVQIIPNGQPSAQSVYATAALLGNYSATLTGNNPENALIGGDATTNLFQRSTTGSSVTTTTTYGGPDRWAYWSGASTAMTVSQDTTAADLPTVYKAAFKMARTSGQTGVVQVCMAQEVESVNAYRFRGQTAELDFHAVTGSNFSGTGMTAYIVTGTGTDEGIAKMAYGINAGGGGGSAWAGQANAVAGVVSMGVGSAARYTVVGPVPATATEIGVALCFTPTGTAGTNDYVALSGIQLVPNSALTAVAGTAGAVLNPDDTRAKAFLRRPIGLEAELQRRYYYRVTESASAINIRAQCSMSTTSIANCLVRFPTVMRIAPTMTYTAGFQASASTASSSATVCTALTTTATLTGNAASTEAVLIDCASSAGFGAAGTSGFLWDIGTGSATGIIQASAEL